MSESKKPKITLVPDMILINRKTRILIAPMEIKAGKAICWRVNSSGHEIAFYPEQIAAEDGFEIVETPGMVRAEGLLQTLQDELTEK